MNRNNCYYLLNAFFRKTRFLPRAVQSKLNQPFILALLFIFFHGIVWKMFYTTLKNHHTRNPLYPLLNTLHVLPEVSFAVAYET